MRRAARVTAAVVLTIAVGGFAAPAAAAEELPRYVALGDSFTAGPLVPLPEVLAPLNCLRSTQNYPKLVAQYLGYDLRDVSCSGATTDDMTVAQGENPPQFSALDESTDLVTIGIGGNDIGFIDIAITCASLLPIGTPCQKKYVVNGVDLLRQRIDSAAPKVAAAIQGIHDRAPNARVLVVGYLALLPPSTKAGICWPLVPITAGDIGYLHGVQEHLNAMIATQAAANGATYVDAYTPSIGHDACRPPLVRWTEPVVPVSPGAPLHPNRQGMFSTADAVVRTIQAGGPVSG
jgi:lysophospholipase L1-like esterase